MKKTNLFYILIVFSIAAFMAGCEDEEDFQPYTKTIVAAGSTAVTGAPYSPGVKIGATLYCSGRLGTNPDTGELGNGIKEQTKFALESLRVIINEAGMKMSDVVSVNVFLLHLEDYADMNETYKTFFPKDPPARATVEVSGLVRNALVEISCIAVKTE